MIRSSPQSAFSNKSKVGSWTRAIAICRRLVAWTLAIIPNHRPNFNQHGSYPSSFAELREINDSIEAGFNYTTSKRHIKYSFYTRTVFNGNNSDQKFWIGGGIEMPFQIFKRD